MIAATRPWLSRPKTHAAFSPHGGHASGGGAEAWRQRSKFALPYKPAALTCTHMRAIFLSEMRMALVRIVHASDEIKQIAQSHAGKATRSTRAFQALACRPRSEWVWESSWRGAASRPTPSRGFPAPP